MSGPEVPNRKLQGEKKGALGSPITDDSGFPKTDSPITLWHGVFCSIECSAKRIDSAAFEYNSLVLLLSLSSHFSVQKTCMGALNLKFHTIIDI